MVKLRSGFNYFNIKTYDNLVLKFNNKVDSLSVYNLTSDNNYRLIKIEKKKLDTCITREDRNKIYDKLEILISMFLINLNYKKKNLKINLNDNNCLICYSKIGNSKSITCNHKEHIFHKKCFIMNLVYNPNNLSNLNQCPYCLQYNITL